MVTIIGYIQAHLVYMLEDKTMFKIPQDEIGQRASDLVTYSMPFTLLFTWITSYLYEIIGRRWTIFISFVLTGGVVAIIPYSIICHLQINL